MVKVVTLPSVRHRTLILIIVFIVSALVLTYSLASSGALVPIVSIVFLHVIIIVFMVELVMGSFLVSVISGRSIVVLKDDVCLSRLTISLGHMTTSSTAEAYRHRASVARCHALAARWVSSKLVRVELTKSVSQKVMVFSKITSTIISASPFSFLVSGRPSFWGVFVSTF